MRDGVKLATDVWRQEGPVVPRPVVLRRTPYGRNADSEYVNLAMMLNYVLVSQDVRGRGGSEGDFLPFFDDAHDGADTATWLTTMPFCDGKISTFGGSAEGIVQMMAMGEGIPSLRSAFVLFAPDDLYESFMPGGAWRTDLTTNWLISLGEASVIPFVREHEALDEFWEQARLNTEKRARVEAPVLLVGGFFDAFAKDVPKAHRLLQQQAAPSARSQQFLVLGPWTHGGHDSTKQGEVTFEKKATYQTMAADWLTLLSATMGTGAPLTFPPVRYYRMELHSDGVNASGEWLTSDQWPPPSTPTALYLHDDGTLTSIEPDASTERHQLTADPSKPIPSIGGGNLNSASGPYDQSTLDARSDVLVATTFHMHEDVDIVGDVTARVYAASSSTDADVVVRLSQVTPSGKAMLLTDGVRRGRFVQGFDAIRPLTPDQPALFEVDLGPVAARIPAGHAIRVSIQPSSSPRYEANPGVAVALADNPTPTPHTLFIYRDSSRPSFITLPVVNGSIPVDDTIPVDCDAGSTPNDVCAPVDAGDAAEGGGLTDTNDPFDATEDAPDSDTPAPSDDSDSGCGCRLAVHESNAFMRWPSAVLATALMLRLASRKRRPQANHE